MIRKKEIARRVSVDTGFDHQDVTDTVNSFLSILKKCILNGDEVAFNGLGRFIMKERKQRMGWDFQNKKPVNLPTHKIPYFKFNDSTIKHVKHNLRDKK